MYTIKNFGDYKLFLPPQKNSRESGKLKLMNNRQHNDDFIADNCSEKTSAKISGSFIYAHPPNYLGYNTLNFTVEDWSEELSKLKLMGMDTVIFQAALWSELRECYYPTEKFIGFKNWNVIEPMLEAAGQLGLSVFLGGYGSVTCWMDRLNDNLVEFEKNNQLTCFKELMRYRDYFDGFYFSPESAFTGNRDRMRENFLHSLYGELFKEIKNMDSSLKIMMSPATFYYPDNKMQMMAAAWNSLLEGVPLDIMAPQDSIGCNCITLEHQAEAYRAWNNVCREQNIKLWANIEIFEICEPLGTEFSRCPASPERVVAQMNNAYPYVEKMITWEAMYYLSAVCGRKALELKEKIFNG
jgi:hypothetical protein